MAVTYFLTIDGMNGGSKDAAHPGSFMIDDFDFDVSALVTQASLPHAAAAEFEPPTVDLLLNSGLIIPSLRGIFPSISATCWLR